MKTYLAQPGLQLQTLRLYAELLAVHENWAGKLVLCCGAGAASTGLAAAVSLVGGATLAVDSDGAGVKRVFRDGGLDFVVNTLDEALRTLKNEIRKQRPLSVGLVADPASAVKEIVERGVFADLVVVPGYEGQTCEVASLQAEGMMAMVLALDGGIVVPSPGAQSWLSAQGWREVDLTVAAASELLCTLPAKDAWRRTWLQRIAHYQRSSRSGPRWVWLSAEERNRFQEK